ncbi:MAG: VOC family protein [SAR202 cluster bacterium]|nr:VOC family protein [SAR202 cluster bacterium]
MIRHEDIHHLALVATDLQRGMEEVGAVYGVTWTYPRHLRLGLRDSAGDREVALSVVYSNQGPLFLELFEAVPDTVWAASPHVNLHHIGVYVDDVGSEIERLEGLGLAIEACSPPVAGRPPGWAYMKSPAAIRIEVLDAAGREANLRWARGEVLPGS